MAKRNKGAQAEGNINSGQPPDQDQRDLIVRELDKNILVEAAAGTGKTTSLIARMVNLIRAGKCSIDKLAAVTYTRKAAAELRARFQVALEKSTREAVGAERDRLAAAVAHIERGYLGTIHSFCARLLRERPVEAGIDATFRELDEPTDLLLRRRAWDDHVAFLIASDDPLLSELETLGLEIGLLAPTFEQFANYPDVNVWPIPDIRLPDSAPIVNALLAYVDHMDGLVESFPVDLGKDKLMFLYRRLPRMVRQADLQSPAQLGEILEQIREFETKHLVQKNWPGGGKQAKAELEAWNEFALGHAVPFVIALRQLRYGPILRVLRSAIDRYDRLRREAGGLNFQDLLLLAARLLRDKPKIREYFRNRFTHLLVDEFQDTDPIQAEVMLLLTGGDPTQTNWRRCRPVDGSLFIVGDPKQSIYRFRRADIATYNEVRQIIEESGGRVASLTANFRSTTQVVKWVNATFAESFPEVATDFAPACRPLEVGRAGDQTGDLSGVYHLPVPGGNKVEALDNNADFVARFIHHALTAGHTVPRTPKELEQGLAPAARPGDFLIVTRNTRNLSLYANRLQELDVPHQVTGGTALNELGELRLLCICLNAVVRPDDPVALVATLRSELFGISDEALYGFKRAGGLFKYRSLLPAAGLPPADEAVFRVAFERLARYDHWLRRLPAAAAFERIAGDLGLLVRACARPGGDVCAGTLAKALELVRTAGLEMHSVTDLVEHLGDLLVQTEKHDGLSVRPHDEPVVRVMNLHKVKGLEAPVVFLVDPTGESDHEVKLHIDRAGDTVRGYLAIYEPKEGYGAPRLLACPANWDQLASREEQFQTAENDRLLYVAATRAGTCLAISQRNQRNHENPWRFFVNHVEGCPPVPDAGPQARQALPSTEIAPRDPNTALSEIDQRWNNLRRATYSSQAIKEIALTSTLPRLERAYAASGEHGVEWGTLIHALLEAAARFPKADLFALARAVSRDQAIAQSLIEAAVQTVQAVQQSELWKRAQASSRHLVEVPIQFLVPGDQNTDTVPTIQRGVIDLLFLEANGWVIADYKTDDVAPTELPKLADHYRPQVRGYADAWHKLVRQPVHEAGLFFTRAGVYYPV